MFALLGELLSWQAYRLGMDVARKKTTAPNYQRAWSKTVDEIALVFLSLFRALVTYSTGIHLKPDERLPSAPSLDQATVGWDEALSLRVYLFVLRELYVLLPDTKVKWVEKELGKLEEDISTVLHNKASREAEAAWAKVAKMLAEEVMK
jgi:hypothetical protein